MRFKEFKPQQQIDELVPAIGQALKTVGGAAIQATRNAASMAAKKVTKPGTTSPNQTTSPQGLNKTVTDEPVGAIAIPAVGSEIVLPDKDTKKPGSFTIKSTRGNNVELSPVVTAKQIGRAHV